MTKKNKFCCKKMNVYLKHSKIPLRYFSTERSYSFLLLSHSLQLITYCPWCGNKLPKCLDDIYAEILEKEYGINDYFSYEKDPNFPEEFKTDEWWIKRGL